MEPVRLCLADRYNRMRKASLCAQDVPGSKQQHRVGHDSVKGTITESFPPSYTWETL